MKSVLSEMSSVGGSQALSVHGSVSFLCLSSACSSSQRSSSCRTSVFTLGFLTLWLQPEGLTKKNLKICFQHIQSTSVFSVLLKSPPRCLHGSIPAWAGRTVLKVSGIKNKLYELFFLFSFSSQAGKISLLSCPGRCAVLELPPCSAEG